MGQSVFALRMQADSAASSNPMAEGLAYASLLPPYTVNDASMVGCLPYDFEADSVNPIYVNVSEQISALAYAVQEVLAMPTGASLIGYRASPSASVPRAIDSKMGEVVSVKDFGAVGDGVSDDSGAISAALSWAASAPGSVIYFPSGTYLTSSSFSIPDSTTLTGAGAYATTILSTQPGLVVLSRVKSSRTAANIEIRDLSIGSRTTGTVGVKFVLCVGTALMRVGFLGCAQNYHVDRGYDHTIRDCFASDFNGIPCGSSRLWSSVDTDYVYDTCISNFRYLNSGVGNFTGSDPAALYIRRGVNLTINQINANSLGASGTYQNGIILENDCQGVLVSDCLFVHVNYGLLTQVGSGVSVSPSCTTLHAINVDQATASCYGFVAGTFTTVIGGCLTPNLAGIGINPIVIYPGASFMTFDGTTISGFSGSPGGSGFYFNGCSNISVVNCQISGCTNAFQLSGTTSNLRVIGNNTNACANKVNGSVAGVGNYFSKNGGFNSLSVATPSMAASGIAYQNNFGIRCTVYVTGGSISGYSINGHAIGGCSGAQSFDLEPGETIQITYTGSPSWTWIGH